MIIHSDRVWIWKDETLIYFKVLAQKSPGKTEEKQDKPQDIRYPGPDSKRAPPQIKS
jgi:hypothetical protein